MSIRPKVSMLRFVRRKRFWVDRLRSYKVFVDDRKVGDIGPGRSLEIALSPGSHLVRAKIDWCRAEPLHVDILVGETVDVEIANRWGAVLGLWAVTFGSRRYLTLRRL